MATYLSGKNATVTINGTLMEVMNGSYDTTVGVDDISNITEGGYGRDKDTMKRATVSLNCVYNGDSPPSFDEGDEVALAIAVTNGPGLSGTFRIGRMSWPVVDMNAAVKYSFDMTSQGPYTKT